MVQADNDGGVDTAAAAQPRPPSDADQEDDAMDIEEEEEGKGAKQRKKCGILERIIKAAMACSHMYGGQVYGIRSTQ